MKIALFQTDIVYEAPIWNLDKVSRWVEGLKADTDLAILPEFFDTGSLKTEYKETIRIMTELAIENNIAICFSTLHERHNRFCFIHPDGRLDYYDKRHSYPLSGEGKYIETGCFKKIILYKGFRILPQICYDLRFPVWSYNCEESRYDIAIYLASWPDERICFWDKLLEARAIENICYVIGVNRIGDDRRFHYPGHSKVIDFKGQVIKDTDSDLECSVTTDIDMESLKDFRSNFCTFEDSEKFRINS